MLNQIMRSLKPFRIAESLAHFIGVKWIGAVVAGLLLALPGAANVRAGDTPAGPAATQATGTTQAAIDWEKARKLYQRQQQHETLTDEEQAYLDRAKAAMRSGHGPGQPGGAGGGGAAGVKPPGPPRESTGLVPLPDLTGKYKDQDGGLYGQGRNDIPEPQNTAALRAGSGRGAAGRRRQTGHGWEDRAALDWDVEYDDGVFAIQADGRSGAGEESEAGYCGRSARRQGCQRVDRS